MSKCVNKLYASLGVFFFSISPTIVGASSSYEGDPPPELKWETVDRILTQVVYKYIFPLAGLICFLFIVKGGYMWMISAGDPDKVKQAQGTLTWSVIGLVFVIVARLLLSAVMKFIA